MISFATLSSDPLVFEPISSLSSVFYDSANGQVFTLRAKGAMGVNVKSLESRQTSNFRISDKGEVSSIKFNPDCTVLSLQRRRNRVDFINFQNGYPEDIEYSQICANTATNIIGFVWSKENEIVLVTNKGFELYEILPDMHAAHALKHGTIQTNWYTWDPLNKILLLSTGDQGNRLHVTSFQNSSIKKCSSFEVPEQEILSLSTSSSSSSLPVKLQQKNCLLANLYGQLYACILSHGSDGGVQLVLYQLMWQGPVRRQHILVVPEVGRIAVSFVCGLVIVHHQHSRTSLAYDIASAVACGAAAKLKDATEQGEADGWTAPRYHYPLLPPISLAEVSISCKNIPALFHEPATEFNTPLYASSWIICPPNVVIDGGLGCLWTVELNFEAFTKLISDPIALVDCLLNRSGAQPVLRRYCQGVVEKFVRTLTASPSPTNGHKFQPLQLEVVSHLFSRFADVQKAAKRASKRSKNASPGRGGGDKNQEAVTSEPIRRPYQQPFVFSPDDVFETMLSPIALFPSEDPRIQQILSHLILEYIGALKSRSLIVDPMFHTLLVECLIKSHNFTRLIHLIRSGVIVDSTEIANQLLSVDSAFLPSGQLVLDMLQRLGTSNESILEILLAKGDPIAALKFCKDHQELLLLPETPRKVLDASKLCEDPMVFYSVFRFFERAAPLRCPMMQDFKFRPYVAYFANLFGPGSLVLKAN